MLTLFNNGCVTFCGVLCRCLLCSLLSSLPFLIFCLGHNLLINQWITYSRPNVSGRKKNLACWILEQGIRTWHAGYQAINKLTLILILEHGSHCNKQPLDNEGKKKNRGKR
jgi:hypothetical protein